MPHVVVCEVCGKHFKVPPTRLTLRPPRWCSMTCRTGGGYRKGLRPLTKACAQCGREFRPQRIEQEFCSQDCAALYRRRGVPDREPTPTEWAWLAGFIDGEGTFSMGWGNMTKYPRVQFSISGTHEPTMRYFAELLGRKALPYDWRNPRWRRAYRLGLSAKNVLEWLLNGIKPYSRTKAAHIPLATRLLANPHDTEATEGLSALNRRGQPLPDTLSAATVTDYPQNTT